MDTPQDMVPFTSTGPEGFRFIGLLHPVTKWIVASVWGWEREHKGKKVFRVDGAYTDETWRLRGMRTFINELIFDRLQIAELIYTYRGSDEGGAMYHRASGYKPLPGGEGVYLDRDAFEYHRERRACRSRS